MTIAFPSRRITKKFNTAVSADNAALSSTIIVPATRYGALYKLWVSLDSGSEADVENGAARMTMQVTIGSVVWSTRAHLFIAHTDLHATNPQEHRWVDLGPWDFDFGDDGLYSGVKGDDIVLAIDAAGTGIKTRASYLYSGD